MVRNVVFDIGGVLIDFDPVKVLQEKGLMGEDLRAVVAATAGNAIWRELDRGVIAEQDVVAKMKEVLPPNLSGYVDWFFDEGMKSVVHARAYSAPWLKSLKDRGLGVYLLSNYPVRLFKMHMKAFDFLPYTDGRIVSGYVQVIKPDPKIYRLLLEKYSLTAAECVFVDDVLENVEAARKEGMKAVHFVNYEDAKNAVERCIAQGE